MVGSTTWLKLPVVVTTDLRLNEPRFITLPNIMKAKKKQLDTVSPADLGVDVTPRLKTLKVAEPPGRAAGIKVPDVATLVDKLKNEGLVSVQREGTFLRCTANTAGLEELLGFLYAECCTRNKAVEPGRVTCCG